MLESKDKDNWLLNNIVPLHVIECLKRDGKYCRTHNDVGIIFAKVCNFDNFYDESYQGGIEYLRVLNELIGDLEELFEDARFNQIEKIKTIGCCLMAASGLNVQESAKTPGNQETPNRPDHLVALVDFCLAIFEKLRAFNASMLNFEFNMTIGYNIGQVTSGVVGTSKMLFDIWGDAVNVASRMYSTGVHGRVQLTEQCHLLLNDQFDFEFRGEVFVKGKGDMRTYLLVGRKN
ncbi:hypothetical protein HELRODRAFT_83939 [Helobdella robusta]|uniref:adenylate cyclase n=1 Tax=Helobdella robusta TaxID=6412 RepID=T1G5C1_HELRO|nr:hypothetical protein HELRODRAFT_83939 [Helobdella robusta]ESN99703.1 hypothetical protein HELRODRAFT_83939 [Helobdella robusta]